MDMQTSAVSWLDMSDSYDCTCEALSIVYGTQESDMNTFKAFVYEGYLMESGATRDIVMEGAFDIFKSIADGIKKFIERIKEFFKKILLYITAAYDDLDKVAKQAEPIVKNMKEVDFTIDGYKFTVLDTSGPNIKEFQSIVSEYNSDMEDLVKVKDAEIKKKLLDWMSDSHLDKLRAEVLGVSNSITEDDYLDEIRKHYRDGEDSSSDIKVTKSMVMDIIGHAKRLEDVKKSAIKDRDNLITLLSRTETFFNKNLPTMYRGNQMQGNTAKISVADNKFSKEDNYQNVSDSSVKLITTYATFKSRQVNKIASMINLVACERVNALRDQIKQERVIFRKCLFNDKREDVKVEESAIQIFPNIGYNGRCFTTYAMESNVIDSKAYDAISQMVLLNEATFLTQSALTNRVHYLMEVDMDSNLGKVKSAIGAIIESVVAAFRKKAIGEASKYKPWLDEIKGGLADKAKEKKEFKMANFADADYNAMANTIVSSIRKAYASKDYNDTSFAKDIINSFDSFEKINDDSSRALMLNYFRTGKADAKLDIATFNGSSLAGKVPEMIKYIEQYGNNVTKPAENISNTFKTQNEAFKVTESMMTGNTLIDLIGRSICESDVVSCTDYKEFFGAIALENDSFADYKKKAWDAYCKMLGAPTDEERANMYKTPAATQDTPKIEDIKTLKDVPKWACYSMGYIRSDKEFPVQTWEETNEHGGGSSHDMSMCMEYVLKQLKIPCGRRVLIEYGGVVGKPINTSVARLYTYCWYKDGGKFYAWAWWAKRPLYGPFNKVEEMDEEILFQQIGLNEGIAGNKTLWGTADASSTKSGMSERSYISACVTPKVLDTLKPETQVIKEFANQRLVGFVPVTEKDNPLAGDNKAKIGNAVDGVSKAQQASGQEGTTDAKDKEVTGATGVVSTDKPGAEEGIGEKKTNNAAVTYKKNVDRFFKNCITLYIKAREEQFIAYVNALSEIDGGKPKFDKNGKYLSKEKEQKEDEAVVQTESK